MLFKKNCSIYHNKKYLSNGHWLLARDAIKKMDKRDIATIDNLDKDYSAIRLTDEALEPILNVSKDTETIVASGYLQHAIDEQFYNLFYVKLDDNVAFFNEKYIKELLAVVKIKEPIFKMLKNNSDKNSLYVYDNDNNLLFMLMQIHYNDATRQKLIAAIEPAIEPAIPNIIQSCLDLAKNKNIIVNQIGTWLWVSGKDTKLVKDELKSLGFRWSLSKSAWYYSEHLSKQQVNYKTRKYYDRAVIANGIKRLNDTDQEELQA